MSVPKHHTRQEVCATRASYREGRKSKAVKVYTVNQESQYLLVQGVPVVGASHELVKLFAIHGAVEEYRILDDYPAEQFTEVYLIKFKIIQAARHAKRKLDDWSFFGGVLHVCYAPEYETIQETRQKLLERRKTIAAKTRQYAKDGTYSTPLPVHVESSATVVDPNSHTNVTSSIVSTTSPNNYTMTEHIEKGDVQGDNGEGEQCMVATMYGTTSDVPHYSHQDMLQPPDQHSYNQKDSRECEYPHNVDSSMASTSRSTNPHHNGVHRNHESWLGSDVNRPGASNQPDRVPANPVWQVTGARPVPTSTQSVHMGTRSEPVDEEQLWLPRPPQQIPTSQNPRRQGLSRHNQLMNYEYALVPTAQAEFPVGFDARLGAHNPSDRTSMNSETSSDEHPTHAKFDEAHTKTMESNKPKTIQETIEESLKKKDKLLIMEFKPQGAVTRFIPRQAQPKQKSEKKEEKVKDKVTVMDNLSKQIRKDAFTLGQPQGPEDVNRQPPREPDAGDLSVNKSVKDIRKRMLQLTENPALLSKKQKSVSGVDGR